MNLDQAAETLTVAAVTCGQCGATLWPAQNYGCERCGALPASLREVELPARGSVKSFAEVLIGPHAPYTVVEVHLDDGPVVRALGAADGGVRMGERVAARDRGLGERLVFAAEII